MTATMHLIPKYYFGKGAIENLASEINQRKYKRVCILYGGGSVKKHGIFDQVVKQLEKTKVKWFEFGGIEPNPRDTTCDKAVEFMRKNKIDLIIAVGGGSVIDASKVIGVVANNKNVNRCWDYVLKKTLVTNDSINIFSVITLAGTASENNNGSVITNWEEQVKIAISNTSATPLVAFEDPTYTFTLSKWQLGSGIFDCFSHFLEQYFGKNTFGWTQEYIFGNLRNLIRNAKISMKNPKDYDARANLLFTTSMGLNSLSNFNSDSDWNVHGIEHAISAKWDVTHGAGLALITPSYIKVRCAKEKWFKDKTLTLAKEVFGVSTIDKFISELNAFIKVLGLPTKFTDFEEIKSVSKEDINFIIDHAIKWRCNIDKKIIRSVLDNIKK